MKLYYMPGACSLASHIALHETGLRFEIASVDRKNRKTSDGYAYEQVNPKGYVPALRLDDDQVLTENVAVLLYIADRNPQAHLAPGGDGIERYRLIEWLAFLNSEIHKSFTPLFNSAASEDTKQLMRGHLARRLDWLNATLGSQSFLMRDAFTVADAYLFTLLRWGDRVGVDVARRPNLQHYHSTLATRPSVVAAMRAEGLS